MSEREDGEWLSEKGDPGRSTVARLPGAPVADGAHGAELPPCTTHTIVQHQQGAHEHSTYLRNSCIYRAGEAWSRLRRGWCPTQLGGRGGPCSHTQVDTATHFIVLLLIPSRSQTIHCETLHVELTWYASPARGSSSRALQHTGPCFVLQVAAPRSTGGSGGSGGSGGGVAALRD